jgi:GTP-binding protein
MPTDHSPSSLIHPTTASQTAPIDMSLDACVEYIASDEILEVTPTKFRMAKNPDMMGKKGKK